MSSLNGSAVLIAGAGKLVDVAEKRPAEKHLNSGRLATLDLENAHQHHVYDYRDKVISLKEAQKAMTMLLQKCEVLIKKGSVFSRNKLTGERLFGDAIECIGGIQDSAEPTHVLLAKHAKTNSAMLLSGEVSNNSMMTLGQKYDMKQESILLPTVPASKLSAENSDQLAN